MTKAELAEPFVAFLRTEGYVPTTDEDGDIRFKCEGWLYLVVFDEDDPQYFRLILPNFYSAEDDTSRREAIEAANKATAATKVAKLFLLDDGSASATVELFATPLEAVLPVFVRSLGAIKAAVRSFIETIEA